MLLTRNHTKKQVRSAVKTTRKAMNKALDRAEPRIEEAAEILDELRRDAARGLQRQSEIGRAKLRQGFENLQARVVGKPSRPWSNGRLGRTLLITAGVVTVAVGLMR
jgi:cytochrome c-type biogenesis protein CcmH/NrfG